ncbi:lipopolysaccharide kinase InaA family protein [Halopseudomonas bauzanensis]|uniref:lipopolysaccharide kinase InaA family protein n=1 Tax=Halopseudomonas bauzanensis TaxID=653930 RepID=UPI002557B425|nr:lipopolysaccharide kinase InaA family protein [Halopseudomonas bauzanensis]
MTEWVLNPAFAEGEAGRLFADLPSVFALQGERITSDDISEVHKLCAEGRCYYIKRYVAAGKNLRRLIGRPRIRAEWENLLKFARWGIPTVPVVAYGMERNGLGFGRGALITLGIDGTDDLAQLARRNDARLRDRHWLAAMMTQVARATRTMHDHGFAHNDLKWRNILVDRQAAPQVYFIDCPAGSRWPGPLLRYRIIKDLACLDKVGKYHLRRTDRLRFYLDYSQRERLTAADKKRIRAILAFFEGRE